MSMAAKSQVITPDAGSTVGVDWITNHLIVKSIKSALLYLNASAGCVLTIEVMPDTDSGIWYPLYKADGTIDSYNIPAGLSSVRMDLSDIAFVRFKAAGTGTLVMEIAIGVDKPAPKETKLSEATA